MKPIAAAQLAHMAKGTWYGPPRPVMVSSITIDSRIAKAGSLFVALSGETQDGHDHVIDAFHAGASCALIDAKHAHRIKVAMGDLNRSLIVVDDPLRALQKMAQVHVAAHTQVQRVGVSGSCGKTTTKEMIASVLSTMGKTAKTPGNFNSEIGLPISVFEIEEDTAFGVFEMGVDHVGEMDRMLEIWKPQAAVITNIGISHIGKMGSVQVIAKEKSKLFHPDIQSPFLAEHSAWMRYIEKFRKVTPLPFGRLSTEGIQHIESLGLEGYRILYCNTPIHLRAVGNHNLMNALAAISVAQSFGARPEEIAEGFERFVSAPGRSRVIEGPVTVIADYYNSSVDSTATILDYMGSLPCTGRKRAVLGSMKELGSVTEAAHQLVARKLIASKIDDMYLYGKEMESAWLECRRLGIDRSVFYTDDYEALQRRMIEDTKKGDLVLIKGSRSMTMERLVPAITSIA